MTNADTAPNPDLDLAKASLQQSLNRYAENIVGELSPSLQADLDILVQTIAKLDRRTYTMAVFGLVSRGKSAVLNALIGDRILETGPLNGVTRFPRSVRWSPDGIIQIDAIDTPGLDEIEGEARGKMAREVAKQSDLILFIIAGDISKLEYQTLCELREAQKPLILVFNKSDLYPESERQTIYQQLQGLGQNSDRAEALQKLLSTDEVVMVAADPAPIQVRTNYADGTTKQEWEKPPANIENLKAKILELIEREGRSLLAINALVQARDADENLAKNAIDARQVTANQLIWKFARGKAIAVAINPFSIFDLFGGILGDGGLIRSLSTLYNLPMTKYQLTPLFKSMAFSGGSLLLGELISFILFGNSLTSLWSDGSVHWSSLPNYLEAGAVQGAIAAYGAYRVGKSAQSYLAAGSTWGNLGANTAIESILDRVEDKTIISRLRSELSKAPIPVAKATTPPVVTTEEGNL
jgi:uncharacterized protein